MIRTKGTGRTLDFLSLNTVAVGEAMVELAPVATDQYRRGFAGDRFNTAWPMAQVLQWRARVGFATGVGSDPISDAFVAELTADGLDVSAIGRDPVRSMGLYMIEMNGVERSFHFWRDTSTAKGLASDPGVLSRAFAGAGLIHLSGITLAILSPADRVTLFAARAEARENGARVSAKLPSRMGQDQFRYCPTITSRPCRHQRFRASVIPPGQAMGSTQGICRPDCLGQAPENAVAVAPGFSGDVIRHPGARLPKALVPSLA